MLLQEILQQQDKEYELVFFNFSSKTEAKSLINLLQINCNIRQTRTHEIWEPKDPQKTLVLFCDEINLPINDSYDTALIHEFLRVLISEKGFFNEKTEK